MEDRAIIALYETRQERAIEETAKRYGKGLQSLARNILTDPRDREESVSDTYLRAWNTIPPARPDSLRAYLFTLLRHIAIDRHRSRASQKRQASEYAASLDELGDCVSGTESPEDRLLLQDLAGAISEYLRALPEQQRNIFLCRYYFCDPIKQIAGYFGSSEGKVKSVLHRTRQSLKNYLQQEGFL